MSEPIVYGTVDFGPLIQAAAHADVAALDAALDRLTPDEVAFVADLTLFLNRRAGPAVTARLTAESNPKENA